MMAYSVLEKVRRIIGVGGCRHDIVGNYIDHQEPVVATVNYGGYI